MDKKKLYGTLIGVLTFIALITGAAFAYWAWTSTTAQKTNITFTIASGFTCSADGGGDITSNDVELAPASCTNSTYAIQRPVVVSTTQDAGKTIYLDMWLHVNSISANLAGTSNFKYALTTSSSGCDQGTVVSEGDFSGAQANDDIKLLEGKEYQATTASDTYYLYIWLDSAETDNATQNGTFSFSLGGECTDQEPTLYSNLAKSATPGTAVNFAQTSVENGTNGLYRLESTASDTYPVYFYRGNVNNNVLFNNICWKIVRTTNTGGIKLIYNGSPSNGECNNTTGSNTQLDTNKPFNTFSNSLAFSSYMYDTYYVVDSSHSTNVGVGWIYGPDIIYSNGIYTLVDKGSYVVEKKNTVTGTNLNYHHYTCGSSTNTTCTSVKYVVYVEDGWINYITLSNGKRLEDIWDDMWNVTKTSTSSTIKSYIDTWFGENMLGVLDKLEDTIWCNDKTIHEYNSWNPDGGRAASSLIYYRTRERFENTHVPSVECTNKRDSYTVSDTTNGNGALTYPVGLLTMDEINMAGAALSGYNNSFYLYTNRDFWSLSPAIFSNNSYGYVLFSYTNSSSYLDYNYVSYSFGVRPSVSLNPSVKITGGDGTATNPYIVN